MSISSEGFRGTVWRPQSRSRSLTSVWILSTNRDALTDPLYRRYYGFGRQLRRLALLVRRAPTLGDLLKLGKANLSAGFVRQAPINALIFTTGKRV